MTTITPSESYDLMRKTMSSLDIFFPFYIDRVIIDDDGGIRYMGNYRVTNRESFHSAYVACNRKNFKPMVNSHLI